MKKSTARSHTPTLDTYKIVRTFMPEEREVEKYVCPNDKTIYINAAAKPGAKIVKLIK